MNFMSTHTHVLKLLNLSDLLLNEFSPSTIKAAIKYFGTKHISRFMASFRTSVLLMSLLRLIYHLGNTGCSLFTTTNPNAPETGILTRESIEIRVYKTPRPSPSSPVAVQPYPPQSKRHKETYFFSQSLI